MPGYVYHLRPKSNKQFCKIGMTNGRGAQERIKELNAQSYGGFCDWILITSTLVENPDVVERTLHNIFACRLVPTDSERELFYVSEDEVEEALAAFKSIPINEHLEKIAYWQEKCQDLESQLASCKLELENLNPSSIEPAYTREKRREPMSEPSNTRNFRAREIELICRKCAQHFTVTLTRYETDAFCPKCSTRTPTTIEW